MNKLFDPDNWFWRGFGRLADLFLLTMVWMACSIPLITAGTATIALFDTVTRCIRGGEDKMMRRYFGTFKKNLLRGILLTAVWAAAGYLLAWGWQILDFLAESASIWTVFRWFYLVTLLLPLGVLCWVVALQSRYAYRFGQLHRAALTFAFGHLSRTAAIVGILVAGLALMRFVPYLILFVPALIVHLQSGFAEKAFEEETLREGTENY